MTAENPINKYPSIRKVCVYCASSRQVDAAYFEDAAALGRTLAHNNVAIVYGGGAVGLMGRLADAALAEGGKVIGVLPGFMNDLEWGHSSLTELVIVPDMHLRKQKMAQSVDAVIALPGGCGTMEELLEVLTWKRLGLFTEPIIIVNTRRYFDPLIAFLEQMIREKFMNERHREMWTVIENPSRVLEAIQNAPKWSSENRNFAVQ